ncbi:outer membrane beta-barrel family protein [Pedobacter rhodius]|uniref:Outer membrane beta-barrel family protein n=1 Tax=Pedobacter rhodius TaxID=3004098 RepID=A0ABT4KY96_9SPHI|nr:outer membrane beta-barrel family protein [Pedobacter sp. SJ11]MCZ4223896.1 outer membrane beta-barrel family protein [Pedobacter sp. SJ11]
MKRKLLSLCFLIFCFVSVNAQNLHTIKGRIIDTASTTILGNTSISILNAKDSTMVKFTRALDNGSFEVGNIRNGKYILLVSYPKYADFVDHFTLDSTKKDIDYGKINLTGKAQILADVIIKGNRSAIKIKGDTTEFDPQAYSIEPNSKVEDLIKQFPGIQVDKDGKITAQGQKNVKVLVDGEEFFGDDPTLVTKNIRADMVDKVQLYDKKSDQATFTGIDDGEKTKTLNIKLKENAKNGYFGKATGGIGTDNYYQGQLLFNKFTGKKKFSAYGLLGNNGQVGLNWEDSQKLGSSGNATVSDDGGIYFTGGGDEFEGWGGQYNDQGIPVARTGGLHFDNKWNSDKETLNTNYKIGSLKVTGDRNTISQNNLASGIINNTSNQTFDNDIFRQKLDAMYEIKLDTTLTLKVNVDGTLKQSKTFQDYGTLSTRGDNSLLNTSSRTLTNDADDKIFNFNALLTKKLKKKGRTLSLNLSQSSTNSQTEGYLNSTNSFYNTAGTLDSIARVNQYKVNDITNSAFKSNLAYTEPLSKSLSLIVNYGLNLITGRSDRKSFNESMSGRYDILDNQFSNDYQLNQTINQGGAIFNYKKGKTVINAGSKFSGVNFKQEDLYNNKTYNRNFVNYMPQAMYQYNFSQQKSFRINYNGNTNQPSLDQIQPIRVNTDPLNITLGNPELKPSFRSSLNVRYNTYKVLTSQSLYISGYYSFTNNPIVNNVFTDAAGKSTYQAVNLTDKVPANFSVYSSIDRKILGITMGLGFNMNGNNSYNYINNVLNETKNMTYSPQININRYKEGKYNFYAYFGPDYTTTEASVQQAFNSNGWGASGYFSGSVQLPGKFEINSDGEYTYRGKTQAFNESFSQFLLNVTFSKKFFKAQNLRASIKGNDLLNQNQGFSRSAFNGNITQTSYTTIRRYFMATVSWDFTRMGGGVKPQK